MENIKKNLMDNFKNYKELYGRIGIIAALAVAVKFVVFYKLMGVSANLAAVLFISLIITFLLFRTFNNKWIPAVVFALFSILMFCDVTYSSFFNRYLSVGMLGAAEVVGDIGESIKAIMRPINFVMIIDTIFIFTALAFKKNQNKTEKRKDSAVTNRSRMKKSRFSWKPAVAILLIFVLLIPNFFGINLFQSVSNQEFYTFHIKDIISGILGNSGSENMVAWTDDYKNEKDGPLFGVAKDKNLIVLQIESLQNFVIGLEYNGQEVTPNLNKLIDGNSTYFDNFYQQIGSGNTSDAEFAVNNSLYGTLTSYTYKLFNENYFRGLPVLLKEKGYSTSVFHAHEDMNFWSRAKMYPSEGFDNFYGGLKGRGGCYEMKDWMGWGLVDSEFFPQAVELMKDIPQPFYNFVITISNHHPYEMLDKYKFIDLLPEDEGTTVGKYLQSAAYTDYAIGIFMDELKDAGLYDNSLFVIYGDHSGLTHSEDIDSGMEKLLGKPYDYEEMLSIPLIVHMPDESADLHSTISKAGGQTDVLPTVAYLMGFDSLDTIYVGHNLYTVPKGFVAEQTFMTKGSFFMDDIAYEMSRDGVFENGRGWNINTGELVDVSKCYEGYLRSMDIVNTSEYVLRSDAIRKIFLEGDNISDVGNLDVSRIYPDEIAVAGYPDKDLISTNSIEALNYSVYDGSKNVRLDIYWNDKSEPYTVNSKTGEVEMTYEDIIKWMEDHGSVNVYFNMEKSGDYMVNFCTTKSGGIGDRIVLELPNTEEYSGRYEAILDVSSSKLSYKKTKEFVEKNKVWAVVMSPADAEGKYAKLLEDDIKVYINDEKTGVISKAN